MQQKPLPLLSVKIDIFLFSVDEKREESSKSSVLLIFSSLFLSSKYVFMQTIVQLLHFVYYCNLLL